MRKPPRLYFSFRSPRSWLTLRRLEELQPDAPRLIDYRPHWVPDDAMRNALRENGADFLETPLSRAKHQYLLADTKRLVDQFGYQMVWPADIDVRWEVPHLAFLYARRRDRAIEFYRAAVRARWERGENISDPTVLGRIATEAGLDPADTLAAVDDPTIRQDGLAALTSAYEEDVFAVPYFIIGRHRFWGLERLDDFLSALDAAGIRQ